MRSVALAVLFAALPAAAQPAPNLVVFMDRGGMHEDGKTIPPYRGGDVPWRAVLRCVRKQFAPFAMDIVDTKPAGQALRVVVGGRASAIGADDETTNGLGAHDPSRMIRDATVYVFSELGTGELDIENLCAASVHEIGHALGLDHVYLCGDVMSYYLVDCGPRRILNVAAPCGEHAARMCSSGRATQNTYAHLVAWVGLRRGPVPEDPYAPPRKAAPPGTGPRPVDPYAAPAGSCADDDHSLACRYVRDHPVK